MYIRHSGGSTGGGFTQGAKYSCSPSWIGTDKWLLAINPCIKCAFALLSINSSLCIQSPWKLQPIHPNPSWAQAGLTGSQGGLSSMGGLLLTTRMHHIPLMPPYVLPPATVQPCLAQGLGPDRSQWSAVHIAQNGRFAHRFHHNSRTFTGLLCLSFSIQISLSPVLFLLPRNLVAIKSSLPQFLNQNLAPA